MLELVELFDKIEDEDIFSEYKLKKGTYVRINKERPITSNDYIIVGDKKATEETTNTTLYSWFLQRDFYEGKLSSVNSEAVTKKIAVKGVELSGKSVLSVTPYALIIGAKKEKKDILTNNNFMGYFFDVYYESLNLLYKDSEINFNVKEMATLYKTKLEELFQLISYEELAKVEKIAMFIDGEEVFDKQKVVFAEYCKKKCFIGDVSEIKGERYGFPIVFNAINKEDKPTLVYSNNLRNYPYLISEKSAINLLKLYKTSDEFVRKAFLKYLNVEVFLKTNRKDRGLLGLHCKSKKESQYPFVEFSILRDKYANIWSETKYRTPLSVLNDIDYFFTNKAFYKVLTEEWDSKDLRKELYNKGVNDAAANYIMVGLNSFKRFFLEGQNGEHIISLTEKIMKIICDDFLKKEDIISSKCIGNKTIQQNKFDYMISILHYIEDEKGKEKYEKMAITIKEIEDKLNRYLKGKENDYEITSVEEFLFVSGQVLYYLASHSKAEKKNGLLIPYLSIRRLNQVKNYLERAFRSYGYNISMYSRFNTVYSILNAFKVGDDLIITNESLWFYYNAGLFGQNQFYAQKEQNKVENVEEID